MMVNNYSMIILHLGIQVPDKFTFPFYYEPHPLTIVATKELQEYLEKQTDFKHEFGLKDAELKNAIGKMFGKIGRAHV